MPTKKSYMIKELDCANCAAKIQHGIEKDHRFSEVNVNFMKGIVSVSYEEKDFTSDNEVFQVLNDYVKKYEPDAYLCKEQRDEEPESKKDLILMLLSWILGTGISLVGIYTIENTTISLVLILIGYLLLGYKIIGKSISNLIHGSIFDENLLMIVATIGALYTKEYPEAIAVLLLFQIGEFLQDLAVDRSKKNLEKAMNLKPETATLVRGNDFVTVAPEAVAPDDIILVRPKERVPLDGIVLEGESYLDTSSLTGESVPRLVRPEEEVLSGVINGESTLKIRVTKAYEESTVAKVLDLVENASDRKSVTENFITKFARIYTPIVVLLAVLVAILPPLVNGSMDFSPWIYRACGFLVVSCPCALVISVPLGFFAGIGASSKHGIIVKGSNYLDALSRVKTFAFDKTGTLTKGTFQVKELRPLCEDMTEEELLHHCALLESFSTHPIANSIVAHYQQTHSELLDVSVVQAYEEKSGHGVAASIHGHSYHLGNLTYMKEIQADNMPDAVRSMGTISYLAKDKRVVGYILITDEIKEDAKNAIAALNASHIETVLLTGDTNNVANEVGKTLGLTTIYSDLLPPDKVAKLETMLSAKEKGTTVAYAGDGINDAPVIARADVGFAMGGVGSDAAIEAADIVIMTDEPSKLVKALEIARFTKLIVTTNIGFALGVKFLVLILMVLGKTSMWLAIFADVGVSLLAILNSLRVLRK